jgi:uncharacterized protein YndB with AHSA1/START domain
MVDVMSRNRAVVTTPTDTQILIERDFAAPRHLVYKTFTTPELVSKWWVGKRGEMTLCEIDLRVGGKWRYVMIAHRKFEVAFHGQYREIVPNERLVWTEVYEAVPDADAHPTVNTMKLTQIGESTKLSVLVQCESKAQRDAIINSGMEGGMQEAYNLVEEIAISLAA